MTLLFLQRLRRWVSDHPDLAVLAGWLVLITAFGFARRDFTGDGLRHLPPVLTTSHPVLGEARWLLFPTFVFAIVRPLFLLGIVHDVETALRPMLVANLLLAGIYVESMRRCLVALGARPWTRAAALALAGGSAALFFPAFDITEPLPAAAIAMSGVAFAARRANDRTRNTAERRRAVLTALAAIAVSAFLYQGTILAVGLLPIVVPRDVLRDRRLLVTGALILGLVPLVITGAVFLAGHGAGYAVARVVSAEDNPLYRSYLKRPGLMPHLVALIGGPPQALLGLTNFHGFNGLLAAVRTGQGRPQALSSFALLGLALGVLAGGIAFAIRRRDWPLLLALTVLLILPVGLRHQQYGYLKYYILFPFLLAVGAIRARPAVVGIAAALLLVINAGTALRGLSEERVAYQALMPIYQKAGAGSCWITTAWIPRFDFRWPGTVCPILGKLAGSTGDDTSRGLTRNSEALLTCLDACFCRASGVYTDDMSDAAKGNLVDNARQFHFSSVDLTALVLHPDDAITLTRETSSPVMMYPPAEQQRLCGLVHGSQGAAAGGTR